MGTKSPAPNFRIRDYLAMGTCCTLYGFAKYFPSPIGDWLRYWILKPFFLALGKVRIYEGVTVWYPYRVSIGDKTTLNEWVYIDGFGGVTIGHDVRIAHRVTIMSSDHNFESRDRCIREQGLSVSPTRIDDDVWIGAGAIILPGVHLMKGAIVAAGAVVTKDVSAYTIVAGSPARPVRQRGEPRA